MKIFDDYKFWWKVFYHSGVNRSPEMELNVDGTVYTMFFKSSPRQGNRYEVEYHVPGLFKTAFTFTFKEGAPNYMRDPISWVSPYLKLFGDPVNNDLEQYLLLLRLTVDDV